MSQADVYNDIQSERDKLECADRREHELCILMAWESKTVSVDDACRALGISKRQLFELEIAAIGRGVALVRAAS